MKKLIILIGSTLLFLGCSPENDIKAPELKTPVFFYQDFSVLETDGQDLNITSWTNYAEAGTVKWKQGIYYDDKYAEFSGYQSGQASNIAWLVSPKINMDIYENDKLTFKVAQAYVSSSANSLELYVSQDFDGTNVLNATWEKLNFIMPPLSFDTNFDFFDAGIVDLSKFSGNINIAFKVVSSGTNTNLDGTYELDEIKLFNKK